VISGARLDEVAAAVKGVASGNERMLDHYHTQSAAFRA
jgi:hypothetical protein